MKGALMKKRIPKNSSEEDGKWAAVLGRVMEYEDRDKSISSFYSAVIEDAKRIEATERTPDYRGRGIAETESMVTRFFSRTDLATAKIASRSSRRIPSLQLEMDLIEIQNSHLAKNLARVMWEAASSIVNNDTEAALRWIDYRGPELSVNVAWVHAGMHYMTSKAAAEGTALPAKSRRSEHAEFWHPIVNACGGGRHLLAMSLASLMAHDVAVTFYLFMGDDSTDISVFQNPELKAFLSRPSEIWMPRWQLMAISLGSLPQDLVGQFIDDCAARAATLTGVVRDTEAMVNEAETNTRIAQKESEGLRKRNSKLDDALYESRNKLQKAVDELSAAKRLRTVATGDSDAERERVQLQAALRDTESKLAKSQAHAEEHAEDAARLREFLTLVLEPSADVSPRRLGPNVAISDPATWRLVFVGGHERLHHKLRRVLRNSVFLHPDQSQVQSDVFDNADAVIFSIGYCSHSLAWRAADVVRKRGLRAGYANHSNVDLILDEIRTILSDGEQSAAPVMG